MKKIVKNILLLFLSVMFVLTGCSSGGNKENSSTTGESTSEADSSASNDTEGGLKTFVYPIEHDVSDLGPFTGQDSVTVAIKPLYDYLYIMSNEGVRYYAADELTVSDDGLNITLHLAEEAKWHDGTPLSADDLIFTIKYNSEIKSSTKLSKIAEEPVEYKKVDEKTVEIKLPKPSSDFTTLLGKTMLLPSHLFDNDPSKVDGSEELMKGIGYGPFTLKEWNKGENIIYEKNPNYHRGEPKIDQMIMKIIPEDSAKEVALQNGEISFMRISSKDKYEKYMNDSNFNIATFTESRMNYIQVNPASKNNLTKEMKEAIFTAINLDEIMEVVYASEEMSLPGQGIFCPEDIYYDKDFENYAHDLEKATNLAKETGLDKITLKYIYNNDRVNMPEVAVVVQQQLAKAGIKVELQGMDSPSFFGKFFNSSNPEDDWDLGTNGWDSQMGDSGYVHDYIDKGEGRSYFNESKETNAAFKEARSITDMDERISKFQEGQRLLKEDYTVYPISYPNYVLVSQKNVKGLDEIPSMLLFEDYLTLDIE